MNKTIERDLHGLLPSLTGPLPRELTHLAASLLAQSRSKASSMKPEEEIARGYACAQLACERLKMSLNLPAITSCPPLPPRVYKKVYTYISSSLSGNQPQSRPQSAANTPSRTPSKRQYDALEDTPRTSRTTPSKTPVTAGRSARKTTTVQETEENHLPDWTMAAIRAVCKTLKMPYAAPHIFAGVSSILRLQAERQREPRARAQPFTPSRRNVRSSDAGASADATHDIDLGLDTVAPLVLCVSLMTITELSSDQPTSKEILQQVDLAAQAVRGVVPEELRKSHESWVADAEALQRIAPEAGWTGMEWFVNIEPLAAIDMTRFEQDGLADEMDMEASPAKSRPAIDLRVLFGNVKAAATDWLSEERTIKYDLWQTGIMERISRLEAQKV